MGNPTFLRFLWDQLSYHAPAVRKDLSGQTVVVVGANVGLGYEAAKHFATMGAERVIMACRSKERGAAAVERTLFLTLIASVKELLTQCLLRCTAGDGAQEHRADAHGPGRLQFDEELCRRIAGSRRAP